MNATTTALPAVPDYPAIPDDLRIAAWIDCGAYGFDTEPDDTPTVGDARAAIWMRVDALFGFAGFGPLLFASKEGRLCAAEFGVCCRPSSEVGGQSLADQSPPDDLEIERWIISDLLDLARARTVGKMKREVWRQVIARIDDAGYVVPLTFVAEDGSEYVLEFDLRVRLATHEKDREVIEQEKEFVRENAAERIEELDRCLKRLGG